MGTQYLNKKLVKKIMAILLFNAGRRNLWFTAIAATFLIPTVAPVASPHYWPSTTVVDAGPALVVDSYLTLRSSLMVSGGSDLATSIPSSLLKDKDKIEGIVEDIANDLQQKFPFSFGGIKIVVFFENFKSPSSFVEIESARRLDPFGEHIGWTDADVKKASKSFWGWTYSPESTPDGSVYIQASRMMFEGAPHMMVPGELVVDPLSGLKTLKTGYGYERLAHELTHALLYLGLPSVSEKDHHCSFVGERGIYSVVLSHFASRGLIGESLINNILKQIADRHGHESCVRYSY